VLEGSVPFGLSANRWIDFDLEVEVSLADDSRGGVGALAELDQALNYALFE